MNGYNFTERVRKVLAGARNEANALRHEYVGTEHILLALLAEGEGLGSTVVGNLGGNAHGLRERLMEVVRAGPIEYSPRPDLPYTSRAKRVLELAMSEARQLNHTYVGTEHLLLGLLAERKGIAAQVLNDSGITLDNARLETLRILGSDDVPRTKPPGDSIPVSPRNEMWGTRTAFMERMRKVVSSGHQLAADHGQTDVTAIHLALALLEENAGMANVVLDRVGVDRAAVIAALKPLMARASSPVPPESVLRMDQTALAVLQATESAKGETHSEFAGTQHLLIALLVAAPEVAAVLAEHGATLDAVREQIRFISG
jgi:ATP-dependent Clp protease ATP-binding subunit ClpC